MVRRKLFKNFRQTNQLDETLFSNQRHTSPRLPLQCPFCRAPEDERVQGVDELGNHVILLMFDCPFFFQIPQELALGDDSSIQLYLDDWKQENGNAWLDSLGPTMKERELNNMERNRKASSS